MEFTFNDNIFIESSAPKDRIERIIKKSIDFLCKELDVDRNIFKVNLFFPYDYNEKVKLFHFQYQPNENDPNGIFIPIYFQKEEYHSNKREIIIINWPKIRTGTSDSFIEAVVIHELIHYLDNLNYSYFCKTYNVDFEKPNKNNIQEQLGGYFQARSEMRAKYYQEKYFCINMNKTNSSLLFHIDKNFTKIEIENFFYTIAHACGQIKCWKEIFSEEKNNYNQINEEVINKEKQLKAYEAANILFNIFDLNKFYMFCDNEDNF